MHFFNRYLVKAVVAFLSVGVLGWWLLRSIYVTVPGRYNPRTETYEVWWYRTGFKCVNGYFRIKLYTPLKKHGLCDTSGRIIVPFQYDHVSDMSTDGLVLIGNNGRYGVMNRQGEVVVPAMYTYVRISERYIRVANDSVGGPQRMKMQAFDLSGKSIFPEEWVDYLVGYTENSYQKHPFLVAGKDSVSYVYFFETKRMQKKNVRIEAYIPLGENAQNAHVMIGTQPGDSNQSRYALMDTTGRNLLPYIYDNIKPAMNDVFLVQKGDLFGAFDAKLLEWVLPVRYFSGQMSVMLNGYLVGTKPKQGNRFRYVDRQGRVILSEKNEVLSFNRSVINFLHPNGRTYHIRYNEKDERFYWYRGAKEISE